MKLLIDTREQAPFEFVEYPDVQTESAVLSYGDYSDMIRDFWYNLRLRTSVWAWGYAERAKLWKDYDSLENRWM